MATTYLTHTNSGTGSYQKSTFSAWVKRNSLGATQCMWNNVVQAGVNQLRFEFNASDQIYLYGEEAGGYALRANTTSLYRDTSSWYNIVVAIDTTQGTASDRIKLYVNGVQVTLTFTTTPAQNANLRMNYNSTPVYVGSNATASYFDGLMSHVHWIDGTAYPTSTFGETDSTSGIWKSKTSPSISEYGVNGFFLKFENASAMGTDSSGKSNTFTVGGGTPTQTKDSPDNNFATMNRMFPLFTTTLSLGNTKFVTAGASWRSIGATLGMTTGKYYMEFKDLGGTNTAFGISDFTNGGVIDKINRSVSTYTGNNANSYGYHKTGEFFYNGSYTGTGYDTYTTNNIIGMAVDMDNLKLYFHKNGTYQNSANPSAGSGGYTIATPVNTYIPTMSVNASTAIVNFGNGYFGTTAVTTNSGAGYAGTDGASIFNYQPPTGY